MIFCFQVLFKLVFLNRVRGGLGLGLGLGIGFRVRVRDRVSFRAKGWLGLMYYGPKLFELNSLWRRIRK